MFFHFRLYELRWDLGVKYYCYCFHFSVEQKRIDPFLENVSDLVFRLVWNIQKMKPEIRKSVARENVRPEVLVSLKPFLKLFRNTYVGFCK